MVTHNIDSFDRARERTLRRDLKLLAKFVDFYCHHQHSDEAKNPFKLKTCDIAMIRGKPLCLCPSCRRLLAHALVKRVNCPLNPKPVCKKCLTHCFAPAYRAKIRQVMKYSGRRLVLSGRLDYLYHLLR